MTTSRTTGKQYATFWLGSGLYGVEVERVREVLREQSITRVPLAPPTVAGLINLRGQVVTTIDLHPRLAPIGHRSAESMLVVVLVGGEPVALLVDRIGGVVDVTDGQFEPPPDTLVGTVRELVSGAYKLDGQLLLSLDVDAAVAV